MGYLDDNAVTIISIHRTQIFGGRGLGRIKYLYEVQKVGDGTTSYIASTNKYKAGEIILNSSLEYLASDVWDGDNGTDANGNIVLPPNVSAPEEQ